MHDYQQYSQESFNDYLLYRGHVHFEYAKQNFPKDTRYVTVLRDPVERVLSLYYFVRTISDKDLDHMNLESTQRKAADLAKNNGLRDFLLADLANIKLSTRNQQLQILLDKQWFYKNLENTELVVTKTMETLDTIDCVGVQEFLPFFMLEMCNTFEFEYAPVPRANINADRQQQHDQIASGEQEEALAIIKHFNEAEIIVYDKIKKQIQERMNSVFGEILNGNYSSIKAD